MYYVRYTCILSVNCIQVQVRPPGYFKHISINITTPVVSALKNYYYYCIQYLELSGSSSGFFKPLLASGSRWRFQKRNNPTGIYDLWLSQLVRTVCSGRFTRRFQKWYMIPPPGSRSGLKNPLGLLESPAYTVTVLIIFQGGDDGHGYDVEMCVE